MRKALWWVGGSLVVGLVVTYLAVWLSRPTDEQLIIEALDESIAMSREGRPGGIYEKFYVDFAFGVSDLTPTDIRNIRMAQHEVTVPHRQIELKGDSASITSPMSAEILILGDLFSTSANVKIIFSAETEMKLFIVPVRTWRVTDVLYQGGMRLGKD